MFDKNIKNIEIIFTHAVKMGIHFFNVNLMRHGSGWPWWEVPEEHEEGYDGASWGEKKEKPLDILAQGRPDLGSWKRPGPYRLGASSSFSNRYHAAKAEFQQN